MDLSELPPRPPATSRDALVPHDPPPTAPSGDGNGNGNDETFTVEEGVESLGMGRFQYLILAMAGLCWTADAMEMLLISFIKSPVQCEFNLTDFEATIVTTSVGVGMLFGALAWGMFADSSGRRIAFIAASAVTLFFGLVSAIAPSFWTFIIARALVGFGIGGVPVAFSLMMEFLPKKSRGSWGMGLAAFWSLGALFEAGVARVVMPTLGWRWLIAISTTPLALLVVLCPVLVPESPRWLAACGRFDAATTILEHAARKNGRSLPPGTLVAEEVIAEEEFEEEPAPLEGASPPRKKKSSALAALVRPGVRMLSLQIWLLWFVSAFVYYGAVFLQPDMLQAENAGKHCSYARVLCQGQTNSAACAEAKICKWEVGSNTCASAGILHSRLAANSTGPATNAACATSLTKEDYTNTLFATFGELPGTFATLILIDLLGRRPLLGYLFGLCAVSFFVLLPCPGRGVETAAFFIARATSNGYFQAVYLFTNEIYPSSTRATGMGVSSAIARVGLISTPFVAQYLDNVNFSLAVGIYAGSCLFALITVGLIPIETTRRPLLSTTDELVKLLSNKQVEDDEYAPFATDPHVSAFIRFFRWSAKYDGRGQRYREESV